VQALGQVGQAHHLTTETGGELFATLQRAVGNGDGLGVLGREVRGAQLDHLARAYKQHTDLGEVFKQSPSTMESKPLATRNAWRAASRPSRK